MKITLIGHGAMGQLIETLAFSYRDPNDVSYVAIDGLGHALASEPGIEPEPQSEDAAKVDREVVDWLKRYL